MDVLHGVEVADPFRWLEDGSSPETQAWCPRQDEFARAYLDAPPRREAIRDVSSASLLGMVRYEKFGLGRTWNVEYGSAEDPDGFSWLYSYSPYHRVEDGVAYPAVLFTTFESDTRVDPLHARKMCARLQQATSSDRPVLLRRETKVGHAMRSVPRTVEQAVDIQAFLGHELGV